MPRPPQIEDVNPYLIRMLGYSHAEFLGKKLWEVGPFTDITQSKEMFAELQNNGYIRYEDLPLKTIDCEQIDVEFVSNIYDCDGIKVIQCNISNITERKAAERELRARELTGERIRDKFAASRKRGLWMGGIPPLGYDVVVRKLEVNDAEAELVRLIFRRFLELGSATRLVEELAVAGYRTKSWTTQDGKQRQGQRIDKGFLYKLLNNRVYLGEAVHKGVSHPGEHQALIPAVTWERVQSILAENGRRRGNATRAKTPAPLKGLLRCAACGSAMTPSHTRRRGRLYRYYTCTTAIKQGHAACPVRSLAAGEAETLVLAQLRQVFRSPEIIARTLTAIGDSDVTSEREVVDVLASLDTVWDSLFPTEQQRLLHLLVEQVGVTTEGSEVHLRAAGLRSVATELQGAAA